MPPLFSNPSVSIATQADIGLITGLLNSTYRGDASRKGWTTEADLISGEIRATNETVKKVMEKPGSVLLRYFGPDDQLIGCVNLQKHGDRTYLGMFSVSPSLQGGGIGKQLLKSAEEYALSVGCHAIYMHVISLRSELIDWYKRHGYADTGKRVPFEEDGISGKHLQKLEFMVMEKRLV